jgi:hypothetical protein
VPPPEYIYPFSERVSFFIYPFVWIPVTVEARAFAPVPGVAVNNDWAKLLSRDKSPVIVD